MLTIRNEQMRALEDGLRRAFAPELLAHARACHAERARELGDAGLEAYVGVVLRMARQYGVVGGQDLCRLLDLATIFGTEWDQQPSLAWMHEQMLDPALPDPTRRLALLFRRALHRLDLENG